MRVEKRVKYRRNEKVQTDLQIPEGAALQRVEMRPGEDWFTFVFDYPDDWQPGVSYPIQQFGIKITTRALAKKDMGGEYELVQRFPGFWAYTRAHKRTSVRDTQPFPLKHGSNTVGMGARHTVNTLCPAREIGGAWCLCARGDKRCGRVDRLVVWIDLEEPDAGYYEQAARRWEAEGKLVRLQVGDDSQRRYLLWVDTALLASHDTRDV